MTLESLPRIAGTLDKLDGFDHGKLLAELIRKRDFAAPQISLTQDHRYAPPPRRKES